VLDYMQYGAEPPRSEPPAEFVPQRPASLAAIISRIEQTVEEETTGIRTDMNFDLKTSNARKSRYLYELSKAVKGAGSGRMVAEQREAILRLRETLARNEAAIRNHLNAVNEVASLIQGAIQRADADGTYSAGEFGRR
jgi:seryl-tRNA(Sec) selenium transferase